MEMDRAIGRFERGKAYRWGKRGRKHAKVQKTTAAASLLSRGDY